MQGSEPEPIGCAGGIIGALAGTVGGLIGGAIFGPFAWLLRAWGSVSLAELFVGALASVFIGAFAGLFAGIFTGLPAGLATGAQLRLAADTLPDLRAAGTRLGQGAGLLAATLYWWWLEAPALFAAMDERSRLPMLFLSFTLHIFAGMLAGAAGGRQAGRVFGSELQARLRREQD